MIIIDSSSLSKFANKEQDWEKVERKLADREVSTLDFAMLEIGNSIWKRVSKKEIPAENALSIYKEIVRSIFEDGLVILVPAESALLNDSLELAIREKITTYDSAFIELANKNKCELVTSDGKQRDTSKKRYPSIRVTFIK